MEHTDSRTAHPHQASADERACHSTPGDGAAAPPDAAPPAAPTTAQPEPPPDPVCFPDPAPAAEEEDGPWADFPTDAEAEAYYKGLNAGIRAAGREPGHPHMPADFSLDLMRAPEAPALVSTRLVEAFPLIAGEGAEKAAPRGERHDGWTGAKMKRFLQMLAETGVVTDACRVTGMSRKSAYALRNSARGRAFALGWDAALLLSAPSVADDVASRSRYGVVDRVYRDGKLVAERHRYDNRLTMAVLTRLDRQLQEMRRDAAAAARIAADEWEQYLAAVEAGEGADAFLAARAPAAPAAATPAAAAAAPASPPASGCGDAASEAALLGRLATFRRFGVGLPSEIPVADLDPVAMEGWSEDQIARAEASGFLARLAPEAWPQAICEVAGDGADGMCDLRYLYLKYAPPPAAAEPAGAGEDKRDGGGDAPPEADADPAPDAEEEDDFAGCIVWQRDSDSSWWTDFPPPPGFDGRHEGVLGTSSYVRTLTDAERRMMQGGDFPGEETGPAGADGDAEEDEIFGRADDDPGGLQLFRDGWGDGEDDEETDRGAGARSRAARLRHLHDARRRFFDIDEDEEEAEAARIRASGPGAVPEEEGAGDGS